MIRNSLVPARHPSLDRQLDQRRDELGMPHATLARHSGVSIATVKRILAGRYGQASFDSVVRVAQALGVDVATSVRTPADDLLEEQARIKAIRLVDTVQGTSALEAQGVDDATRQRMIQRTVHDLLAGPRRRLWGD